MSEERAKTPAVSDAPAEGPTFSEEQVAEILQRTAHLERVRSLQKTELTLAEIEQIAREAGLDPSLVRVAAESLEEQVEESGWSARLLGAVTQRTFEREIEGEITAADHEQVSAEIRTAIHAEGTQRPPQLSAVGRTLSLAARTRTGRIELSIAPRAGKTILRIEVDEFQLAGGLYGALLGGVGMGFFPIIIALSVQHQLGLPGIAFGGALWFGTVYATVRGLFSWRANKQYERMENLADQLAGTLRKALSSKP